MSLWILDTDTLSLLEHEHPAVTVHALLHPVGSVQVSIVTVQEAFIGRYNKVIRAKKPDDLVEAFGKMEHSMNVLRRLEISPFDSAAAEHFVELSRRYRRIRRPDLQIAAVALSHDATLVTRNRIDFSQIVGLRIEDWSQ